jgi:hypothetical protein
MNSEEQRDQAGNWQEIVEEQRLGGEVGRLISERNREDAEEHRNTMETMRQVAEAQRTTREGLREATREGERQETGDVIRQLLERMTHLEERIAQLDVQVQRLQKGQ